MMCGMRRKRDCLAAAAMGPTVLLSSTNLIKSPYIPNCCFNLGYEKSNTELARRSNRNRERFGLLFKEAFAEPNSGKVEWEIKVEQ
jgi:hypothetical protein